jgi:hypothetical protein
MLFGLTTLSLFPCFLSVLAVFLFLFQTASRSERLHMFARFPFHGLDKEVTKFLKSVIGSRCY